MAPLRRNAGGYSIRRTAIFELIRLSALISVSSAFISSTARRRCVHSPSADRRLDQSRLSAPDNRVCLHSVVESEDHDITKNARDGLGSPSSVEERFHADMRRVLESRQVTSKLFATHDRSSRPMRLNTDPDGAQRVYMMLRHMITLGVATETSCQIVMEALAARGRTRWAKGGQDDASKFTTVCAGDVVGKELYDTAKKIVGGVPSLETCHLALEALSNCASPRGNRGYAEQAQQILDEMKPEDVTPKTLAFVLKAWSWQQFSSKKENYHDPHCRIQAHSIMDRLTEMGDAVSPKIMLQCCSLLLEASSKSSVNDEDARATEGLLKKMVRLSKDAGITEFPTNEDYANAIIAWNNCALKYSEAAKHANTILDHLLQSEHVTANSLCFQSTLAAWTKRPGYAKNAEEILWKMNEYDDTFANTKTVNSVLHAYMKQHAIEDVERLFDFMNSSPNKQQRPDEFTYKSMIKAYQGAGDLDTCKRLLKEMEEKYKQGDNRLHPTNHHYNIIINMITKSDDPQPWEAYEILQRMQASASPDAKPDVITYTSVIECFSKSSDPRAGEVAQELLEQAFAEYENSGDESRMPNIRTFTMVILALCNSPSADSAQKAYTILQKLENLYEETKLESLRPNEYPYNYVLNAAANTQSSDEYEKGEAFKIASKVLRALRSSDSMRPDGYSYAFWFKCCGNLLPVGELQAKCIRFAFEKCTSEGLLHHTVLKRFVAATPGPLLTELVEGRGQTEGKSISIDDLPPSWSRNVRKT